MVVIRLSRGGAKRRPFYRIVVTEKSSARDGRFIDQIGYFNPIAAGKEIPLSLNIEKADAWIAKGAQPSPRVASLIKTERAKAPVVSEAE